LRSARKSTLLAIFCLGLALALPAFASAAAFEPNDSIPAAAGPLVGGQTYTAAIETPGDRDLFYFYVSAASPTPLTLSFNNLGGGSEAAALNAAIVDSLEAPIDPFAYAITAGLGAATTITLDPGKYYVAVGAVEGSAGAVSYSLTTAGGFGSYEEIAKRCADATKTYKASAAALQVAQGKLQRATARLRRARFASATAKRRAGVVYRRAARQARAKRKALKVAGGARAPWCSIPR
jgi:hypothetical protein